MRANDESGKLARIARCIRNNEFSTLYPMKYLCYIALAGLLLGYSCAEDDANNDTAETQPESDTQQESTVHTTDMEVDSAGIQTTNDPSHQEETSGGMETAGGSTNAQENPSSNDTNNPFLFGNGNDVENGNGIGWGNGAGPEESTALNELSHDAWNTLLASHVSGSGNVDYDGFKTDKADLEEYLEHLQDFTPESNWSTNKTLAYWINVYNAYTVKLIVDNYPCSSITDLEGGKPWDKKFITIDGKTYSLSQVENDIIRKYNDPRIHFAVNCASKSCPKLLNKAYTESNLNTELDKQTAYYLSDTGQNKLDSSKPELSQIFNWYAVDFDVEGGVIAFINDHSDTEIKSNAKITYLEYDWNLND